jgi:hypothetical protein
MRIWLRSGPRHKAAAPLALSAPFLLVTSCNEDDSATSPAPAGTDALGAAVASVAGISDAAGARAGDDHTTIAGAPSPDQGNLAVGIEHDPETTISVRSEHEVLDFPCRTSLNGTCTWKMSALPELDPSVRPSGTAVFNGTFTVYETGCPVGAVDVDLEPHQVRVNLERRGRRRLAAP